MDTENHADVALVTGASSDCLGRRVENAAGEASVDGAGSTDELASARLTMANSKQAGPTTALYFDDLRVGQRFTSDAHLIDDVQITAFAKQFDPQPFHLDAEAAKATLFEGLVASGWHTAAITMRLLVESLPIAGGAIGAGGEIAWPKPTRPGAILRVESEILELRPSRSRPDRGLATIRSETQNQLDESVQVLVAKLIVPRRPNLTQRDNATS
jgi:acyl dehydratase